MCIEFKTFILQRNVRWFKIRFVCVKNKKLVNSKKKCSYIFFTAYLPPTLVFFYFVLYAACLTVLNLNLRALVSRLSIAYTIVGIAAVVVYLSPPRVCVCVFGHFFGALCRENAFRLSVPGDILSYYGVTLLENNFAGHNRNDGRGVCKKGRCLKCDLSYVQTAGAKSSFISDTRPSLPAFPHPPLRPTT